MYETIVESVIHCISPRPENTTAVVKLGRFQRILEYISIKFSVFLYYMESIVRFLQIMVNYALKLNSRRSIFCTGPLNFDVVYSRYLGCQ